MSNTINTPAFKVNFTYTMLDHAPGSKTICVSSFVSSANRNAGRYEELEQDVKDWRGYSHTIVLPKLLQNPGLLRKVEDDLSEARRILRMLESHLCSAEDSGTFESVLETKVAILALTETRDRLGAIAEDDSYLP